MKKILLIDDKANLGWASVLTAIIKKQGFDCSMDICLSDLEVEDYSQNEYDLIFLDLRLTSKDHLSNNPKNLTTFDLLKNKLRDVDSKNFTTPIILFTASNKIWNIDAFLDEGADAYFIKEHPEYATDAEYSKENYRRLLRNIKTGFEQKAKRQEIWSLIQKIISKSKDAIENTNRQNRIKEKLLIGYGILDRKRSSFEQNTLIFNQEIIAYLVFWSILDEIAFEYLQMDYSKNPISAQIKIKGSSKLFIEDLIIEDSEGSSSGIIKTFDVNKEVYRDSEFKEKKGSYDNSNEDQISYFRKKQLEIFLSKKISAILYFKNNWGKTKRINNFKPLNDFRNSIDFIHPSFEVSQSGSLKEKMDSKEAYKKCIKLLSFINSDLLT